MNTWPVGCRRACGCWPTTWITGWTEEADVGTNHNPENGPWPMWLVHYGEVMFVYGGTGLFYLCAWLGSKLGWWS